MNRRTFIALFIVGTVLRIVWINVPPLWYDENFTLILARLPFRQMMQATAGDVHPPLWYLIEWIIFHVYPNAPAWMIRFPALIASMGSLPLYAVVMRQLRISPRVQTVAFGLMAVLPFQLWYAQEGRMYALLELLVLVTLAGALSKRYWIVFLGALGLLYTQNYGLFYLASIALVIVMRKGWRPLFFVDSRIEILSLFAAMGTASLMWLPWLHVVASQMREIEGRYWVLDKSLGGILIILYKMFFTASVPRAFFAASYFVAFTALIVGVIAVARSKHPESLTVGVLAFMPVTIAWIASLVWQPVLLFRALIGISPFLYIVACWGVEEIKPGSKWFAGVIAGAIVISGIYGYYKNIEAMKGGSGDGAGPTMQGALAFVSANWREGDVIVTTDDGPWINLSPYTDKPIYKLRLDDCAVWGSLSQRTRDAMGVRLAGMDDIQFTRAWIFAPLHSPLHSACYVDAVATLTVTEPVYVVDDSEWLFSGVWMVEK